MGIWEIWEFGEKWEWGKNGNCITYLLRQIGQNPNFCWFLVTLHRSFSLIFDPNDHVEALNPYHKTD